MGKLCYCDPCHSEDIGDNHVVNRTCALLPSGKCFASIQVEYIDNVKHEMWKYGCLAPDEQTLMQVSNIQKLLMFATVPGIAHVCCSLRTTGVGTVVGYRQWQIPDPRRREAPDPDPKVEAHRYFLSHANEVAGR